jgi:hypothetical protein
MSTEGDYFTEVDVLCGLANTNRTNISKDNLNKNFFYFSKQNNSSRLLFNAFKKMGVIICSETLVILIPA